MLQDELIALLRTRGPLTTLQVYSELTNRGEGITLGQVVNEMMNAEQEGLIKRIKDESFDELKPLTSVKWLLSAEPGPPVQRQISHLVSGPKYVESIQLVISQPAFAFSTIEGLKGKINFLEAREGIEKVIIDATSSLRIVCPYYDEMLVDILSRNTDKINSLSTIRILADAERDPARSTIMKIKAFFPKTEIKYLYRASAPFKIGGVHAKILMADKSEALLGSFNLTYSHVTTNIDVGVILRGPIVRDLVTFYDALWAL